MELCILDLASLRYQWNPTRSAVAVCTARGELFSVVDVRPGVSDREAAFQVCDAALDRSRLTRHDPRDVLRRARCRLGLYNPHTGEVALGPIPNTRVFSAARRLPVPPGGLFGELIEADDGRIVVWLPDAQVELQELEPGCRSTLRSYRAHQVSLLAD